MVFTNDHIRGTAAPDKKQCHLTVGSCKLYYWFLLTMFVTAIVSGQFSQYFSGGPTLLTLLTTIVLIQRVRALYRKSKSGMCESSLRNSH